MDSEMKFSEFSDVGFNAKLALIQTLLHLTLFK